jgi:hypothetical protein
MALPTIPVLDGNGDPINVNTLNSGRRAATDSAAMVLSTEDFAALTAVRPVTQSGAWMVGLSGAIPAGTNPIGSVTVSGSVAVTGALTDAQLRATAVPVSATSLPLPTGAATAAAQATGNASLTSIDGKLAKGQATKANSHSVVFASDIDPMTIAGTVTASFSGSLPAGGNTIGAVTQSGAWMVGLSGAIPAGNNNIGDVDVASVPQIATTTRALDYANGVTVTAGAASSASAAIAAAEICVHNAGTVRAYIRQGSGTPTASVAATSLPLEAGEKIWLRHTSGHAVAAIRDGASDTAIRIIPVA